MCRFHRLQFLLIPTTLFLLCSCSDQYMKYTQGYHMHCINGIPDYSNLDYWAAHPYKLDLSDSVSKPLRKQVRDSTVDVFFIHPTTYTLEIKDGKDNAAIDDSYINAKTDYSTILYQASVFNGSCRVFAPRYRQANLLMFIEKDSVRKKVAFELAYQDLKVAFIYYLEHYNNQRPFIIAAHSQGSLHAKRLIKEMIEGTPLQNRLVCAYLPGMPVEKNYFNVIKPCEDSLHTGCFVSWRTFRKNYTAELYTGHEKDEISVTNPLTWTTNTSVAPKSLNRGAVLYRFNSVYKHVNDARIHNNILWISKPRFPWGFTYLSKNYHLGDINLFYMNIREDVKRRIGLFWKN
jgi:hypothetical protein